MISLKRGSGCLESAVLKKPRIEAKIVLYGKRKCTSLEECTLLFKKTKLEESIIELQVKEVVKLKYKPSCFVRGDLISAYIDSVDPRHFYALDIQRVYRGWFTRMSLSKVIEKNSFM